MRAFRPLESADLDVVRRAAGIGAKYLDSLMLIHDLVCEWSSTQGPPRLAHDRVEADLQKVLRELDQEAKPAVVANVRRNYEFARNLRQLAQSRVRTPKDSAAVDQMVTEFLESLLQEYRTVRTTMAVPGP